MILTPIKQLADLFWPDGRSGRQEYITALTLGFCLSVAVMGLIGHGGMVEGPAMILPILCMFGLPILTSIRRFHDLGEPTEQVVYLLLPIVGAWYFFRLLIKRGEPGDNDFGPDPRNRMTREWRLVLGVLPILALLQAFLWPLK